MTTADVIPEQSPPKRGKLGLVLGLVFALVAGGAGFFAAYSGMLGIGDTKRVEAGAEDLEEPLKPLGTNIFVELDPLIVNIRSSSRFKLLRFAGQLEVRPEYASDIEALRPRIMDVMNTYLNALEAKRFEDPIALIKLRSQLLRRLQIVTGEGRVEDLLIMEFLLQ